MSASSVRDARFARATTAASGVGSELELQLSSGWGVTLPLVPNERADRYQGLMVRHPERPTGGQPRFVYASNEDMLTGLPRWGAVTSRPSRFRPNRVAITLVRA